MEKLKEINYEGYMSLEVFPGEDKVYKSPE